MKSLEEAQRAVLAAMEPLPSRPVPLGEALGLALSEPLIAPQNVPPFANSAMDGYALRSADTGSTPATLRVVEVVSAGHVARMRLEPGCASKIMTGAPLPVGADAVVPVEQTTLTGDGAVIVTSAVGRGDCIREMGEDVRAGTEVLAAGTRLRAAHLGVMASLGIVSPSVGRRPRVAILSTGDEVLHPGAETLEPGCIRDVNRSLLGGMLLELGAEVLDLGIVPDDPDRFREALERGASSADAVLTSGGVAMGDFDVVKEELARLGGFEFWQIAVQPGKPFAFGTVGGTPVFGLPGNPVAVVVAFEQIVRPALLHLMGSRRIFRARIPGTMGDDVSTNPRKVVFLRVKVDRSGSDAIARLSGLQHSGVLSAVVGADAFAVVPVGVGDLEAGSPVELEMFLSPEARTAEEAIG